MDISASNKSPQTTHRNSELQYLRAIAAMSVLLYHSAHYLSTIRNDNRFYDLFDGRFGAFGVSLFFAISGFLMATLASTTSPSIFLAHRISRIYPIYLLVAVVVFLLKVCFQIPVSFDPFAFALVPGGPHWYLLGVEWTLPFEISFYIAVFGLILAGGAKNVHIFAVLWIAAVAVAKLAFPEWEHFSQDGLFPTISFLFLSEKCLAFALGLLVPAINRHVESGPGCLIVGLAIVCLSPISSLYVFWIMALGCCLLVAAATSKRKLAMHPPVRSLDRLGDWSYALYLVHVPVVIGVLNALPAAVSAQSAWIASVAAAMIGAVAFGKLDIALYRQLKRRVDAARPWVRGAANGVFLAVFLSGGVYWDIKARADRRLIAQTDALAVQFDTPAIASVSNLEAKVKLAGLSPAPSVKGHIEVAAGSPHPPYGMRVSGWVIDLSKLDPAPTVLIFVDGRLAGTTVPRMPRADVEAAFGVRGSSQIGFGTSLQNIVCRTESRVEGLAISGRRYAILDATPVNPECR